MIIYNVTVNVEHEIHQEWLDYMKKTHIPEVMQTGCFIESKICKVLVNEEQGTTYSIQYTCENMQTYERYKKEHAPRLQKDVQNKYANKFVSFRTLLEVV